MGLLRRIRFRFRERGSYIFNNNYRVAKIRYSGARRLEQVEAFYKDQMPLSEWTFVGVSGARKRVIEFQSDVAVTRIRRFMEAIE